MLRTSVRLALLAGLLLPVTACSASEMVEPDDAIADVVGDWEATALVVVPDDSPNVQIDLIAFGVGFFLNIQPSAQYTLAISFQGQAFTEFGRVEIDGSDLVFNVEFPSARVDRFGFTTSPGTLTLTGPFSFDLDDDGVPDDGVATVTLELDA